MKFHRQFEVPERPFVALDFGISTTVPNQSQTMRRIIEKFNNGNLFGISQRSVEFDSDDPNFDFDNPIHIDPSDPLTSIAELQNASEVLNQAIKDRIEYIEANKKPDPVPAPAPQV